MRWFTRAFGGDARGPRDVEALLRSALLAVLDRDYDRAEECLREVLKRDSDGVEGYLALARLFRARGEIGRAIRIHQNVLLRKDLSPRQRVTALVDLGEDFRQGGFLRRAIATFEEVVSRDGKNAVALRALVDLLAEAREYPRAIEMAKRAARAERGDADGELAELYVAMGEDARNEGRHDDARRAAKRALRHDRNSVRAWRLLGTLEAERGRNKAALAAWKRIPEIDRSAGPDVYGLLESAFAAQGRARDYEAFVSGLLESTPGDAGAVLAFARALAARGEITDAVEELRRLLAREPDHLEARGELGRLLLAEGRVSEATSEYGGLLESLERQGLLRAREKLE